MWTRNIRENQENIANSFDAPHAAAPPPPPRSLPSLLRSAEEEGTAVGGVQGEVLESKR